MIPQINEARDDYDLDRHRHERENGTKEQADNRLLVARAKAQKPYVGEANVP